MIEYYWSIFAQLIATPFEHASLIWGIVPLYFGLLLNELTSDKASFRTALQTGFSFLWAGAQWLWPWFSSHPAQQMPWDAMLPVSFLVTFLVIVAGAVALVSGIRKKFPKHLKFIGHSRFANYFMIMIFPIQSHALAWTWSRFLVIVLFATPVWLILHFGLKPLRK